VTHEAQRTAGGFPTTGHIHPYRTYFLATAHRAARGGGRRHRRHPHPLPGPGWLIVLAGLAIWAVEFVWAQRLLHFTRTQLERWWHWLGRQHMAVRLLAGLIGLVFVTTVVLVSLRYSFGIDALGSFWTFITTH
jgi:hypothetical protein